MDPQEAGQYEAGQYQPGRPPLDPTVGPLLPLADPADPKPVRPGVASVLMYGRGVVRVRRPDGRLEGGGRPLRRPVMIQDVDLGRHYSTFTTDLPAAGGGVARFSAEIDIEWQVVNPLQVVNTRTENVVAALRPRLLQQIHPISRRYPIDAPVEAEHAISEWCQSGAPSRLGEDCGLGIQVYVRVKANAQAVANLQKVQAKVGDVQADAIASDEMLRKVDMYRTLIEGGQLSQAAVQIAQDPSNIQSVIGALWEQGAESRQETVNLIKILLSSGAIQAHQISGQARAALTWMETSTAALMGPGAQHTEMPAPPRLVDDRFQQRSLERGRGDRDDEAVRPAMRDRWRERPERPARSTGDNGAGQPRRRAAEPEYAEPAYDDPAYDDQTYDEPEDSGPNRRDSGYRDAPRQDSASYQGSASYQDSQHQDSQYQDSQYQDSQYQDSQHQDSGRRYSRYEEADEEPRDEVRDTRPRTARSSTADSSSASWQNSGYFDDVD
jgi:hypothetical protein